LADAIALLVLPSDNRTLPCKGSITVSNPVPDVPLVPEEPAVPLDPLLPEELAPPDKVYWNCPVEGSTTTK
jgi:hypothetical protein